MKPRFEPDCETGAKDAIPSTLIDPEAYDASEQKFAASLEQPCLDRPPKFIVEEPRDAEAETERRNAAPKQAADPETEEVRSQETAAEEAPGPLVDVQEPADPDSWRREVAARVSHYRARRRTREPRYPSLQLKFESEPVWNAPTTLASPLQAASPVPAARQNSGSATIPRIQLAEAVDYPRILPALTTETTAKVIEFSDYSSASRLPEELAEPVLDRPRIIEAPELAPPPPALGGISIEPAEEPAGQRRPGFEIPLRTASLGRRLAAGGIDATFVFSAFAAFAYIFFRITTEVPSPARAAGAAIFLAGVLWAAYQYLLLVFSGATPGLKLAKLELQRFDGTPVLRRTRSWRVLASVLSGLSLGLGYAWCLLDEDELCWHDRITRTHMAPKK
jgi:uncharacterized RDD family membrane protein YckC